MFTVTQTIRHLDRESANMLPSSTSTTVD